MSEDVHKDRFYVFIRFCRVIGFLLREGVFLYSLLFIVFLGVICIHTVYFGAFFWRFLIYMHFVLIKNLRQKCNILDLHLLAGSHTSILNLGFVKLSYVRYTYPYLIQISNYWIICLKQNKHFLSVMFF